MNFSSTIRRAVRGLLRAPGFTGLAVGILALGLGVSTLMFSVLNGVLLKPLEFPEADRIMALVTRFPATGKETPRVTGGDLVDVQSMREAPFAAISAYYGGEMGVQLAGRAEFTGVQFVNAGYFPVFGLTPQFGRAFSAGEAQSGLVGLAFAIRNFGSGPAALGQTVSVESRTYTISGVLPAGASYPAKTDVWLPAPETPENRNRTAYNYRVVARLRPDVPLPVAQSALHSLSGELARQHATSNEGKVLAFKPLKDQLTGSIESTLWLLMAAVFLVMLISCANVANLLLARAVGRVRELAVCAALGAGRGDVVRQLAAESLVLGLAGGAGGLALAMTALTLLRRVLPADLPRVASITFDWPVFVFGFGLSLAASLVFGLVPAFRSSRIDVAEALKQGGARSVGGRESNRTRQGLVVAQVALSFMLALGAGLFLRSLLKSINADMGFRPEGVLVMYAHAPAGDLPGYRRAGQFFEGLINDLRQLPGVVSASAAMGVPAGQYGSNGSFAVEGRHTFESSRNLPHAGFRLTGPGYFQLLGIPLLRGRDFGAGDQYDAPFSAIVSQSLAREVFPNEDPIGRRIMCGLDSPNWMTIVGVVGDVRQDSPTSRMTPQLYMPFQQHPFVANELQVVVRTAGEPEALVASVRETVRRKGPQVASRFTTLQAMVNDSMANPRFRTILVTGFAALAVLLAMAGVYSVMAYSVSARRAEFGLRAALGARPGQVMRGVTGETARMVLGGALLGGAGGLAVNRYVGSLLEGVPATDLLTYGLVFLLVGGATLAASFLPAWRASRVDPLAALRSE